MRVYGGGPARGYKVSQLFVGRAYYSRQPTIDVNEPPARSSIIQPWPIQAGT